MLICGIVSEYNPFHNGHLHQFQEIRRMLGEDTAIICLMSGNYVQRGAPAVFDKSIRASAAIACGADLVLEMPILTSLSSAEGFARGSVSILGSFCDYLCFGTETGTVDSLNRTAQMLLSDDFPAHLKFHLESGISFPAARQKALRDMNCDYALLSNPNDILAVEYTKAVISLNSSIRILPIHREGSYHDPDSDSIHPSATTIRKRIAENMDYSDYVPSAALPFLQSARFHSLSYGERAILSRLYSMTEADFEALPYGSEGLWRKLMHNCQAYASLETILEQTKSKRYTRTRLDRCVLCAFLEITEDDFHNMETYPRVLALSERGGALLKQARNHCFIPNAGEKTNLPYETLEYRAGAFYGLFSSTLPENPDLEAKRRIIKS